MISSSDRESLMSTPGRVQLMAASTGMGPRDADGWRLSEASRRCRASSITEATVTPRSAAVTLAR
jgi:hypothetical protein